MASKMAANGHVTIIIIIGSDESLYISKVLRKIHSNRLNGSGDTLC